MIPLAVLGDGQVYLAIDKAEPQHNGQHRRREALSQPGPPVEQQRKERHAQHTDPQNDPEPQRLIHHAAGGLAVPGDGNQRKGDAAQGTQGHGAGGGVELGVTEMVVFQAAHGGGAEDEHRHVIPAGIVAGVEGIEHTVEHRHKGADQADLENAGKGVPSPDTAEHQSARNAHHRQIGRHAGVFEDAVLAQVLEIRSVRHEEGAVKDGGILLGVAVDQIPVAVKGIDGARVLHQGKPRREEQHTAHRAAQNRLKGQAAEQPRRQAVLFARHHAGKVDDEEHRLPGKEKVVV